MLIHTAARAACAPTAGRTNRILIGSFKSVTRRYAVLDAFVTRHNAGTVTAGQYLKAITGDDEFSAKYDSPFGKAIKKAYSALHGEPPAKIRLVTEHRRLHRAIGYLLGEPALTVAVASYPRTAALLNGAS
jgi:hypothetical protein